METEDGRPINLYFILSTKNIFSGWEGWEWVGTSTGLLGALAIGMEFCRRGRGGILVA